MFKVDFPAGFLAVSFVLCTACSSSEKPGPAAQGGFGGDSPDGAPAAGGTGTGGDTAATGSAPSTGGGSSSDASNDPDFGIFFTRISSEVALTDATVATHGPSSATVEAHGTSGAVRLSMTASGAIGPGTFDCASGTASVMWHQSVYTAEAAQNKGSCTITATSIATAPGEITEGTFTATVVYRSLNPYVEMSPGRFKIRMQ
jgi:hypothetical protein